MDADERRRVLKRLRRRWPPRDRDWWHPHDAVSQEAGVLCLESTWLEHQLPIEEVRRRARAAGFSRFWVLREGAPHWDTVPGIFHEDFELSASHLYLTPACETICTPRGLDWMAYTDHNEATYLIGPWLVGLVKELWPTWDQHIWTSPFYQQPPEIRAAPWWECRAP